MCIAGMTWYHRETLLPLRKKTPFQKVIGRCDASDSRQAHFLHQAVLQSLEQPLDAPLGLRTLRRDPFEPQFLQSSSKLRAGSFSLQLFPDSGPPRRTKNAVFIGVMGHRTSVAPQPPAQRSQVLFRAVLFAKAGPELAGSVIDQGDQLTSRATVLQPAERRAILHHQFSKTGSALAPHIDLFHALPARAPEGRLRHPLPQRLPAHGQS